MGPDKAFNKSKNWVVLQSFYIENNMLIKDTLFELGFELEKDDEIVKLD